MNRPLILIAEDLESNFLFLKIVLQKKYRIIWAKDGKEAVEMFEEYSPSLVLMDIRMPVIDGIEATKFIREINPDVPIIAQTANAFASDQDKAKDAGCNIIIVKPIKARTLTEAIERFEPL